MWSWARRWRSPGSEQPPPSRTMSSRSPAEGPIPHRAPPPDSETRSFPSVTLASAQPPVHLADEVLRRDPHVREEHLVEVGVAGHLADRADLDAREVHRADEVRHALVLRHIGVGAGDEDPELRLASARRPDLLAVHDPLVAVEHGPGAEAGEVGACARLAEQLAPRLLAGAGAAAGSAPSAPACRRGRSSGRPNRCRSGSAAASPSPAPARRRSRAGGSGRRRGPTAWASEASRARLRPAGGWWAAGARRATLAPRRGADRPRAGARSPSAEVRSGEAAVGPPVRLRVTSPRCRAGTSRTSGRTTPTASPTPPRRCKAPSGRPGATSTGEPTGWPPPCSSWASTSRTRWPTTSTTAREYLEAMFGDVQGRARAGQHELPLRRRRARLPLEQRRRRGRGLPRHVHRRPSSASASRVPNVRGWLWVDDGSGHVPGVGAAATRRPRPARRAGCGRPGGAAATISYLLYTGGTTGMPKGVMWRQDDIFVEPGRADAPTACPRSPTRGAPAPGRQARSGRASRPRR